MNTTDFFKSVRRFIECLGSSTIEGKHIAFLKEQVSALEQQLGLAQRENEQLRGDNALLLEKLSVAAAKAKELESENNDLHQEIEKLRTKPQVSAEAIQTRPPRNMDLLS